MASFLTLILLGVEWGRRYLIDGPLRSLNLNDILPAGSGRVGVVEVERVVLTVDLQGVLPLGHLQPRPPIQYFRFQF